MSNMVIIDGMHLTEQDIQKMNKDVSSKDMEFRIIDTIGIIEPGTIVVLIQLAQGIGVNAIYDTLKFILFYIVNKIPQIRRKDKMKIEVTYNGITESLAFDFDLTDDQKDKLVDAAITKFLSH